MYQDPRRWQDALTFTYLLILGALTFTCLFISGALTFTCLVILGEGGL